jgi:hypothetical protein
METFFAESCSRAAARKQDSGDLAAFEMQEVSAFDKKVVQQGRLLRGCEFIASESP